MTLLYLGHEKPTTNPTGTDLGRDGDGDAAARTECVHTTHVGADPRVG